MDVPRHQNLVQNVVYFVEVENQVQFTDVVEVLVQDFHDEVDQFQNQQFVIFFVYYGHEVQRGVSLVYDFEVVPL
ncbi:MAG: hypothetical protein DHS20C13_26500 [Thermodesulfobacteriota bacterium]|nr:MAG: hypothetical protein DHS20C13_26500 [Thermodesulfobacteriota bacterium]